MSKKTFHHLVQLANQHQAHYHIMFHRLGGKSEEMVKIRGTRLEQGAKALVCHIKGEKGLRQYVLAVLAANRQADLQKLAHNLGMNRASLASPKEVTDLTDCVFGAVPPFSFHPQLMLAVDPSLLLVKDAIAFNAGLLSCSMILNLNDYLSITHPNIVDFSR